MELGMQVSQLQAREAPVSLRLLEAIRTESGPGKAWDAVVVVSWHSEAPEWKEAERLELLLGLPWTSQEDGLIETGVCVKE